MECSFCGEEVPKGKGKIIAEKSGKTHAFCSSKCEKNADLGRIGRKTEWTRVYRQAKKEGA